jgi:hypothetical protein
MGARVPLSVATFTKEPVMSRRSLSLLLLVSSCAFAPDADPPSGAGRQALAATPVATKVLFLVDASGSMQLPIDPTSAACDPGCGEGWPCTPACQTRWDLSRTLVSTLLAALPPQAEAALAIYPQDSSCGTPTGLTTAFSARPDFSVLATRVPVGGTPTAAALSLALSLPEFADASSDRIVVLVTDGLPNCNPSNPANACGPGPVTCQCTVADCTRLCPTGCLDDDATFAAAQRLGARGVQLITVTLGPEWSASPMARRVADGLAKVDVDDASCGPHCRSLVVALEDQAAFARASREVSQRLARCSFRLAAAAKPDGLTVELAGQPLAPDGFTLAGDRVWLGEEPCARYRAGAELAFFSE